MRTLTVLLLSLLVFACDRFAPASDQDAALLTAAQSYVRENSVGNAEFNVRVIRKSGDHARLRVESTRNDTDPAMLFMKRENGQWKGLSLGTGFPPDDLRALGIPPELWKD